MKPIRLAVVCDLREEAWHSMDLIADMLMATLPSVAGESIHATRLCPSMIRRWSRLPFVGTSSRALLADRLTGRLWDYPRWLAPLASKFDVFHIVDHSYAHLVRVLPAQRTVITCHDLDAVNAALPGGGGAPTPSRFLASRVLDGLSRSGHVACVSQATKAELMKTGRIDAAKVTVAYEGIHPTCTPNGRADGFSTAFANDDIGGETILHVGSTIARKRIDLLLDLFAGVRQRVSQVRLIRVGGPLTDEQRARARNLGVLDAIVEMPFLEREDLAALYRRASLVVLPSDREGFGLPVAESLACGTPVVASAIPALQEVGGDGAVYCAPGDLAAWTQTVGDLLLERCTDPSAWERRRQKGLASAGRFSWTSYAAQMTDVYQALAS